MSHTIVEHAVRWASKILIEVFAIHGEKIDPPVRQHLFMAVQALAHTADALRDVRCKERG